MFKRLILVVIVLSLYVSPTFAGNSMIKILPDWVNIAFELKVKNIVNTYGKDKIDEAIKEIPSIGKGDVPYGVDTKAMMKLLTEAPINDILTIYGGFSDYTQNADFYFAVIGKFDQEKNVKLIESILGVRRTIYRGMNFVYSRRYNDISILFPNDNLILVVSKNKVDNAIELFNQRANSIMSDESLYNAVKTVERYNFFWFTGRFDDNIKNNIPPNEEFGVFRKVDFINIAVNNDNSKYKVLIQAICEDNSSAKKVKELVDGYRFFLLALTSRSKTLSDIFETLKINAEGRYFMISLVFTEEQIENVQNELTQVQDK